jgi:hypothetical protein
MKEKIAIVLPVRDAGTGRSERLKHCLDSYKIFTEGKSDLYVVVDNDDIDNYLYLKDYSFVNIKIVSSELTLMQKINKVAVPLSEKYRYISFIGDDIVFRTTWENYFIDFLSQVPAGLAYGNDFVHGERLATHPCITSNMIRAVGFFGCPALFHNYFDNYWMEIVAAVGETKYFPSVIMEHMHPNVGKNPSDFISNRINSEMLSDQQKFVEYMTNHKQNDIEKIKVIL